MHLLVCGQDMCEELPIQFCFEPINTIDTMILPSLSGHLLEVHDTGVVLLNQTLMTRVW